MKRRRGRQTRPILSKGELNSLIAAGDPEAWNADDDVDVFLSPTPRPGSRDAILQFTARWSGPPGEIERLLADVQRMRDEDMALQAERDAVNGRLPD
jgi:hypothetical protein